MYPAICCARGEEAGRTATDGPCKAGGEGFWRAAGGDLPDGPAGAALHQVVLPLGRGIVAGPLGGDEGVAHER